MMVKTARNPAAGYLGALLLAAIATPVFAAGTVKVSLSEWDVGIEPGSAGPGEVRLAVTNTGSYTHAFEVERNGNEVVRTDNLSPGDSRVVTVDLSEGRYEVYCPIEGHAEAGVKTRVKVDADGVRVIAE